MSLMVKTAPMPKRDKDMTKTPPSIKGLLPILSTAKMAMIVVIKFQAPIPLWVLESF